MLDVLVTAANIANRRLYPRGMDVRDVQISDCRITDALAARIRGVLLEYLADPTKFRRSRRGHVAEMLRGIGVTTKLVMHEDGRLEHQHVYDFPTDDALLALCMAYLCDPRLPIDELRQCQLAECGRLFFREGKRRYCSDRCSESGDQERATMIRMPRLRQRAAAKTRKHK